MCLTGRFMDAAEAERAGLVSRVVPAKDLLRDARETAGKIAEKSPLAVRAVKEAVNRSYETTLREGLLFERRLFDAMFATEDQAEGMAAFGEKRTRAVPRQVTRRPRRTRPGAVDTAEAGAYGRRLIYPAIEPNRIRRPMANSPSSKKRARQTERRTEVNKARRSRIRTFIRKVEEAIATGDFAAATEALRAAQPEIMRGVTKGVAHKNTASRKISRLAGRVKALNA